jgi:hypothetical protein
MTIVLRAKCKEPRDREIEVQLTDH